jgi:hypothetical protein
MRGVMDIDLFFDGFPESRILFNELVSIIASIGSIEFRVTKSQIAFYHDRPFAWVWIPEKYLKRRAAPLVLSIVFQERDPSPRWKEIVEPSKGKFMHHLGIHSPQEIDEQVNIWLRKAWAEAGFSG